MNQGSRTRFPVTLRHTRYPNDSPSNQTTRSWKPHCSAWSNGIVGPEPMPLSVGMRSKLTLLIKHKGLYKMKCSANVLQKPIEVAPLRRKVCNGGDEVGHVLRQT